MTLVALPNDSEHNVASFLTDLLCLLIRVAQMPRSQDLAILVLTDGRQNRLLPPLLCLRAWDNHHLSLYSRFTKLVFVPIARVAT